LPPFFNLAPTTDNDGSTHSNHKGKEDNEDDDHVIRSQDEDSFASFKASSGSILVVTIFTVKVPVTL
jgi:hypothetical protein